MTETTRVPKRIAQTVLNSLKGGVVPRIGLPYIAVGRKNEIEALLHDVDIVAEGGASFRFIVGRYGSGKSFLLQTIRNYVMDRGFIVADADLSPERRLQGTRGQGLATYRELIRNLSTKTKPEGGALTLVLDRWISNVQNEALQESGLVPDDPALAAVVDRKIHAVTASVSELVHGFEFAHLLSIYYHAYLDGDDERKAKVVRWFRGEYGTKSEAKEALGINLIYFVVAVVLALIVNFSMEMIVATICLYTESTWGINIVKETIVLLLSGASIPLAFFPEGFRQVVDFLPFRAVYDIPLTILLQKNGTDTIEGLLPMFGLQLAWALILTLAGTLFWNYSVRKITVNGG